MAQSYHRFMTDAPPSARMYLAKLVDSGQVDLDQYGEPDVALQKLGGKVRLVFVRNGKPANTVLKRGGIVFSRNWDERDGYVFGAGRKTGSERKKIEWERVAAGIVDGPLTG